MPEQLCHQNGKVKAFRTIRKASITSGKKSLKRFLSSESFYCPTQGESSLYARGRWTSSEQQMYVEFILDHIKNLRSKLSRKTNCIFLQMSCIITSRKAEQCRTHHQKMMKFYGSIENIVRAFRNKQQPSRSFRQILPVKKNQRAQKHQEPPILTEQMPYLIRKLEGNIIQLVIRSESIQSY